MQERPNTEWFSFVSTNLPEDTFHVIRFTGTEGLNTLFSFTIELVSTDAAVDTGKVLNAPAVFIILRDGLPDARFYGYPTRVSQGGHFNGYTYYTVELRPTFWKLTQMVQSAIFLDQNVQDVAASLLNAQKYFAFAHRFRLTRTDYPKPEFAMQYEETLYDYILWRMEEQGAYFFFAQDSDAVVFADAPQSHEQAEGGSTIFYSPTSGLEGGHREEVVNAFSLSQTPLPHQVVIRNYDWKNPNKPVLGIASVSESGLGDVYLSHEKVASDEQAERLAQIRAEELICRSRMFSGSGSVPNLRPGYVFTLDRHYNPAFNRDYLVTSITHEGSQESFLSLGLGIPLHNATDHLFYRNSFSCIEADVTYRPARMAPRAKIPGMIHAFVDGAGSGTRAELDAYGRYKLLFPFDISGRKNGAASCWIRMAQQQVGQDSGMSFPLLPGTEVVVGFIDGDPDCPVITGALANGETGAITGQANNNFSGIRTAGGNQLTINDTDTHQGISMCTASGNGLTMSSGSVDWSSSSTDVGLATTGVCASDIAATCKSFATGYKISSAAIKEKSWPVVMKMLGSGLSTAAADTMNTLSSKASNAEDANGLKWGAESAKLLGTVFGLLGDVAIADATPASGYGVSLSTTGTISKTLVQVNPSARELASSIIPWFLTRALSLSVGVASNGMAAAAADNDAIYADTLDTCMQKLAQEAAYASKYGATERATKKATPCAYFAEVDSDMATLVKTKSSALDALALAASGKDKSTPEYTNYHNALNDLAQLKGLKSKLETQWNIYCNDTPSNSAYKEYAKQASARAASISTVTSLLPELAAFIVLMMDQKKLGEKELGGVLLKSSNANINLMSEKPASIHSHTGILLNTQGVPSLSSVTDSPIGTLNDVLKPYGKTVKAAAENWGNTLNAGAHPTDFMTELDGRHFTGIGAGAKGKALRKDVDNRFIAATTDLNYARSKWKFSHVDNECISEAKSHFVRSGQSTLFMDDKNIKINTKKAGHINARSGASKLTIGTGSTRLCTDKTSIATEKERVFITAAQQSNINCSKNAISLKAGKGGKILIKKDIDIQPGGGGKVQIGQMVIDKNQIKGTNNGILELAGAIKVIGSLAQVNSQGVEQDAKEALDDLKKQQEDDQKRLDELEKQISELSGPEEKTE